MTDIKKIDFPYLYNPSPDVGKPLALGNIYIGQPDKDPISFPKEAFIRNEGGTLVEISQPIEIGSGGVPMYNGSPVQLFVDGEYSFLVTDSLGSQVYYEPSLVSGTQPSTISKTLIVSTPSSIDDRWANYYLLEPNVDFETYYNANTPILDYGVLGSAPFQKENIPVNRMDLAAGNFNVDLGGLV